MHYDIFPVGGILGGLSLLPHELLHAICYKKDVYLYHDFAQGQMLAGYLYKMTAT